MKYLKSHIVFTKQQRYGIFILLLVVLFIQIFYTISHFNKAILPENDKEFNAVLLELDKLKDSVLKSKKEYTIYPFNPNYITDYKGYKLGMSTIQIDLLKAFRAQNKWINSAKQFQQVTKVSDSLLNVISPFFKFPDWVTQPQNSISKTYKKHVTIFNLNTATKTELKSIYGIGDYYATKIIALRNQLNGFADYVELNTIYGLSPEILQKIKAQTKIYNPRKITSINLNTATKAQLVQIPHVDYEIAYKIIEYRTLHEKFTTTEELTKITDFPLLKVDIIKLYLHIN